MTADSFAIKYSRLGFQMPAFYLNFFSFLCTVVAANQQMRSTTNLLIINLAAADILFVIFCVPFTATDYIFPEWPFGDYWCKYVSAYFCSFCPSSLFSIFYFFLMQVQYMIVVTCHASVYTLVLMSFDRFLAVVHPVTSMSLRTERNAML